MKKIAVIASVVTLAAWVGLSSLLLSGLSTEATSKATAVAILEDETKTFRPVEFSAEINMDDKKIDDKKIDLDVIQKLNKAKQDMIQVCGSRNPATVR